MKRTVLIGAITFLLGAATSPRAANENETLKLLCSRFEQFGGNTYRDSSWRQRDAAVGFFGLVVCGR